MAKNSFRLSSNAGQLAFLSSIRELWRAGVTSHQALTIILERTEYLLGVKDPLRIIKRAYRLVKAAAMKENLETSEAARKARVEFIEQQRFVYGRAVADHDWPSALRASTNLARARGAHVESDTDRILEDVLMPRDILRALSRAACASQADMECDERFMGEQADLRERHAAQQLLIGSGAGNGDGD